MKPKKIMGRRPYYADFVDEDGRRIRKSLHTTDYQTAKQRLADLIARRDTVLAQRDRGDLRLSEFWGRYRASVVGKAESSIDQERMAWNSFSEHFRGRTMAAVSKGQVLEYRDGLAKTRKPRTVNAAMRRLSSLYTFAIEREWIRSENPFRGIKRLKEPESAPKFISEPELERLIAAAEAHSERMYLFCALCAFAGLRSKEAVSASWDWIDFDAGTLTVKAGNGFATKSGRERTIPLHPRLRSALEPFAGAEGYIVAPESLPGKHRLRYEPKKAFGIVVEAAGLSHLTPHMLRHTFGSLLVQKGVSLYKVSQWLGHADFKTTQIYAHLAPQDDEIGAFGLIPV